MMGIDHIIALCTMCFILGILLGVFISRRRTRKELKYLTRRPKSYEEECKSSSEFFEGLFW